MDLDATILHVSRGKMEKSNRPRLIPKVLRPHYRRMIANRAPTEPLFKTPLTESGYHTHRWLQEAMVTFCALAGVPYICPHGLKGTAGTMLVETGHASEAIADHLSHEKKSTTERSYIAPGALEQARTERGAELITEGDQ